MESIYRWSPLYWWSVTGLFSVVFFLFAVFRAAIISLFMCKHVVKRYWTMKALDITFTVSVKDKLNTCKLVWASDSNSMSHYTIYIDTSVKV